ncbi:RIP metalloprotease RseP [Myxococcota bacterium]
MNAVHYILQNLPWFILFIGALVFFHELGHFLVAKACNVKVLRFSFGFGPKLLGFERGETEYRISALPLGGYVKMVGELPGSEIPPEDLPRAFSSKSLWQRSLIVIAGPAFNFALAWVVYLGIALGVQSFRDTRLGVVNRGEAAWDAGLRPGDKILAVDGEPTDDWDELRDRISTKPGVKLLVTVETNGVRRDLEVEPRPHIQANLFKEIETHGRVGISPYYVLPVLGVVDPESPAARAGIATGDVVERINDHEVNAWHELRSRVAEVPAGGSVSLTIARGRPPVVLQVELEPSEQVDGIDSELFSAADTADGYTGLVSKECVVNEVEKGTPAAKIGLKPGDRLLRLGIEKEGQRLERPIGVWTIDLSAFHGVDAHCEFELTYQRGREIITQKLRLVEKTEKDELKNEHTQFVFGASNDLTVLDVYQFERAVGPIEAAGSAIEQVVTASGLIAKGIWKLVKREVPADSVGGPMMLFVIAAESAERGVRSYLGMLALVSVMLGLLNLLPIPVLDGGHLLLFGMEAVRRRPPSLRFREVANLVGLSLLMLLMVYAFRNDIVRFVLPN